MEYDASKIIRTFEDSAREVMLRNARDWLHAQQSQVQKLQGILNTIKINLVHNDEWPSNPAVLWAGLRENLSKIRHWVSGIRIVPEELSEPGFIAEWKKRFDSQLTEFPELLRIIIGESYWATRPDDRFTDRLIKKLQPVRFGLRRFANQLANGFRTLTQRPPYRLPVRERNIHLHLFARYFIDLPVRETLLGEWQKFLQTIFGQLFLIHEHLKDLSRIALISDETGRLYRQKEDPNAFNELYNLAEVLKEIEVALQALDNYQQQLNRRLDQQWKDISQNFHTHWERAGTFQFRTRKYSTRKIANREYRLSGKIKRNISGWQSQWNGFLGQWQKDIDLILLKFKLAEKFDLEFSRFNEQLDKVVNPAFRRVIESIQKVSEILSELNGSTEKNFTSIRNAMGILHKLPGSDLAQLLELLSHLNPVHLPETLFTFMQSETPNLNSEYLSYLYRDSETIPPRSRTASVVLTDIIVKITNQLRQNCDQFVGKNIGKQEAGLRLVSKLDQMIGFNLQMADTAIRTTDAEDRIPEIKNNLDHIIQHARHTLNELEHTFSELAILINGFFTELFELWEQKFSSLFDNSSAFRLQKQHQKSMKKRKIFRGIARLTRAVVRLMIGFIKRGLLVIVNFWRTYILANNAQKFTNPSIEIGNEIKRFLSQTEEKISGLPLVYRNLFKFEPLSNDRLYAARTTELEQMGESFKAWQMGKQKACAIIGEMGSGRTTLLNMARENLFVKTPAFEVTVSHPPADLAELLNLLEISTGFRNTGSMEDLIDRIRKSQKKHIGIIENVNNLFLRTVSGLAVVEHLLYFIRQTGEKIFWVVTGTPYSWQYLQKTVNIDTCFSTVVHLNSFSNGDIESIINARHRMSGFDVQFEPNGNQEENRKLRRLRTEESRQNYLRSNFFRKLNTISAGNITIAMLYWLRAIKEFSNDKVILSVALDFNFSFLSLLPKEELFSLAAIVNHEDLTPFEHSLIFQQTEEKSRLQLTQMAQSGLLINRDEAYEIHPFLYRHLVELLRSRKIIY